jgi:hypothetical protein
VPQRCTLRFRVSCAHASVQLSASLLCAHLLASALHLTVCGLATLFAPATGDPRRAMTMDNARDKIMP